MADYLRFLETHRKAPETARNRADNDILPQLGNSRIDQLTTGQLREWLTALASRPRFQKGRPLAAPKTEEEKRRRRCTANRTLTVLKAALNKAFRDNDEDRVGKSDKAWRNVAPFPGANAARIHYLQREECVRLINAADESFRRLANAALLTGCRYGELTRLRVEDFNSDAGTLHVRQSKSGKGRHVVLTDEAIAFFQALCAGRPGTAIMLTKADGSEWKDTQQAYFMRVTCKNANLAPINFHALRHTYASHAIMDGLALMIVARNLGHVDTKMVEKHYGHLADDHVTQLIRKLSKPFGTVEESKVVPFVAKGAAS